MFLESIGYTATLIEYVARLTGRSVPEVTMTIGFRQVFDLCHNAPMNRLLPIDRIAEEVISDNYLRSSHMADCLMADTEYGDQIKYMVNARTNDKHQYVNWLYDILTESQLD